MYSVGILSGQEKWPEVLAEMLKTSGSSVSGWVNPQVSPPADTQQLIDFSDLIWIPEKISGSMEEAIQVIRRSRHLSLGFPVVEFMEEAPGMVKLAHEARVQVQIGHPDWYNPVVRSVLNHVFQPQSIRFTDHIPEWPEKDVYSHVFKTIVADLDLALGLSGSTVRRVRPHVSRLLDGTAIQIDIRVEMHNGTVISLEIRKFTNIASRQIEILQPAGILNIDLLNGTSTSEDYGIHGGRRQVKTLWPVAAKTGEAGLPGAPFGPNAQSDEEAARQCLSFIHALEKGRHSLSSLEGGFRALEITRQIETAVGSF